jgi:hypothetical protein
MRDFRIPFTPAEPSPQYDTLNEGAFRQELSRVFAELPGVLDSRYAGGSVSWDDITGTFPQSLLNAGQQRVLPRTSAGGSIDIAGADSGYAGVHFVDVARVFYVNGTTQGIFNTSGGGWQWSFDNGVLSAGTVPAARVTAGTFGTGDFNFPGNVGVGTAPAGPTLSVRRETGNDWAATVHNAVATANQSWGLLVLGGTTGDDRALLVRNAAGTDLFRVSGVGEGVFFGGSNNALSQPGTLALKNPDSNPYLSFHNVAGDRLNYVQGGISHLALWNQAALPILFGTSDANRGAVLATGALQMEHGGRFKGWMGGDTTGLAAEIGIASGQAYIYSYNRDSATFARLNLGGANLEINPAAGGAGFLTIENLPTSNPGGTNRVWRDSGVLKIT